MKIAAAFLADAANVREGTLGVLSGFINTINRDEYPAPLGATLVVVVEYDENEARRGLRTGFVSRSWAEREHALWAATVPIEHAPDDHASEPPR